ncbi:hypothetical protein GP486_005540 [Trichoglossum hirsutum]|uniref:non-specific serine/threonine protein kinase n=1 Tax=Trichoglossum hirsutum TaxID=265104 RepID=A0A9P8L8Z6_9PEZI|nr:hypothetical protein GP486_005540 [Trichoglossum hirsutum]
MEVGGPHNESRDERSSASSSESYATMESDLAVAMDVAFRSTTPPSEAPGSEDMSMSPVMHDELARMCSNGAGDSTTYTDSTRRHVLGPCSAGGRRDHADEADSSWRHAVQSAHSNTTHCGSSNSSITGPSNYRTPSQADSFSTTLLSSDCPTAPHHASESSIAGNTPASSPKLYAPGQGGSPASEMNGDGGTYSSPFLHWTQRQAPKETHVADVDFDPVSGRKLLNQYEIVDEIGRGVHGKVKLGRNLETNGLVAIKIVDRYPKRRRLGKSQTPEDKVKKEVAILKKCRHPNIVSLLEVVDDPAKKKVYIVLEYVELGEIIWRKKGDKHVIDMERRRKEYEQRGLTEQEIEAEEARILRDARWRRERQERRRARQQQQQVHPSPTGPDFWSLEHGGESEGDGQVDAVTATIEEGIAKTDFGRNTDNQRTSAPTSHTTNSRASTPFPSDLDIPPLDSDNEDDEPTTMFSSSRSHHLMRELDGTMYGAYVPEHQTSTPSVTNSFSSHLSSENIFDPYEEEHSYVPCLTLAQARQTFRDTVLGLEYLHYQGIIHRDIKPANLLWTSQHRVKISDFGVSYLGRPIRDDNSVDDSETDAENWDEAIELAKTVGTPAFYAPELCYTDFTKPRPSITGQIDVWALGVTLYCLIFACLPFLAEDEFALFKTIAEERVFIPRKRLRATGGCRSSSAFASTLASTEPASMNQFYESIDEDLHDLLKRLLRKDSTQRITLREVKRHPWVLHGITNPVAWIEETDPSRQNEGKKIEVSTEEVEKAVVPIGIIERVRSGIRKMGQAIMGKGREREGGRRRARSTVPSEETSPAPTSTLSRLSMREGRRSSLGGDELITTALRSNSSQRLH